MGLLSKIKTEIAFVTTMAKTAKLIDELGPEHDFLLADDWERTCDKYGANPAIIFENKTINYSQFDALANRYANWGLSVGLRAGEVVAIFMQNRPDYIACWYGLSKIGVVSALINQNLTGSQLSHCVKVANSKAIIVDMDLAPIWDNLLHANPDVTAFLRGGKLEGFNDLDRGLNAASSRRPSRNYRAGLRGKDPCLYLYTSGTTGHPKAAVISQSRVQGMSRVFIPGTMANHDDKIYIALPLYHGTGGVCAVGLALNTGGAIVLKGKFSASQFWDDIVNYKCTIFVYIGELFRYLVSQAPQINEKNHKLKSCFGNGLRPDVWDKAEDRFKIPRICEFYGSTEGNVFLINAIGKKGAIGRVPKYMKNKINIDLVKFDVENEEPIRDENGLCVFCKPDEIGEAVGYLNPKDPKGQFDGYANDKNATEKKILRNVVKHGDVYFRTGDLMKQDKNGYFYFIDRIGDTFRWKSENVATSDVGEALATFNGVIEANAFGIPVPFHEGKAGMAVIVWEGAPNYDGLLSHLKRELPNYAVPIFLRQKAQVETTSTFKYKKTDLVNDGYDINLIKDKIYWLNPQIGKYEILDENSFNKIKNGEVRF